MKTIIINGETLQVEVDGNMPLLWLLRDVLKLKGTKYGCGIGLCGACTVHLDGAPVRSCQIKADTIRGKQVVTIEGICKNTLHLVQRRWIDHQVPQCGYCQSGQIMSAVHLLSKENGITMEQILQHMRGNLCRCGTYDRIKRAIENAAALTTKTTNDNER